MLQNRIAAAQTFSTDRIACARRRKLPEKVQRGGDGLTTRVLRVRPPGQSPLLPYAGDSIEMDSYGGRGGSSGGEETGADFSPEVPRCGHFGRKRYSLLRPQRRFPRPVFWLIPFRVSPPLFTFPAFFSVRAAPYLFFLFFLRLAVCGPRGIIVITWIRRHTCRRQNIISTYAATHAEKAPHGARNSSNS